jgi:AcrR family transcriptional regulator
MSRNRDPAKRERLVQAADRLVQGQGFEQTTLADIARVSSVPLGNVYYYFKSKDAIGEAIVEERASRYRMARAMWDVLPDPRQRLLAFVQMPIDNRDLLALSGCPIGSLCQELHKERGKLAEQASSMFTDFLAWLEKQFQELGKGEESRDLAVYLMSVLEGATLLSHSFNDPDYIVRQCERLKEWIAAL